MWPVRDVTGGGGGDQKLSPTSLLGSGRRMAVGGRGWLFLGFEQRTLSPREQAQATQREAQRKPPKC